MQFSSLTALPLAVLCLASCAGGPATPADGGELEANAVTAANAHELAVADTWVVARFNPDQIGLRTSNNPVNDDYRCVHSADNALWAWSLSWLRPANSLEDGRPNQLRSLLMDMEYPDEPQIRRGWKLAEPSALCTNKRTGGIPFQPLHGVVEVTAAFGGGDVAKNFIERELDYQAGKIATEQSDSLAFHMLSAATATQIEKADKYRGLAKRAWGELRSRIDSGRIDFTPDDEVDRTNTLRYLQIVFAMRRTAQLLGDLDQNLVQRTNSLFNKVTYDAASHTLGNGIDRCDTEQCYGYYLLSFVTYDATVQAVVDAHRSNRCEVAGKWRYRNRFSLPCTGTGSLEATALGSLGDWRLVTTFGTLLRRRRRRVPPARPRRRFAAANPGMEERGRRRRARRTGRPAGGGAAASAALLASRVVTPRSPATRALEPNETLEGTQVFVVSRRDRDVATLTWYAIFNNLRDEAPDLERLEREASPEGIQLVPRSARGRLGSINVSSTESAAVVVLARERAAPARRRRALFGPASGRAGRRAREETQKAGGAPPAGDAGAPRVAPGSAPARGEQIDGRGQRRRRLTRHGQGALGPAVEQLGQFREPARGATERRRRRERLCAERGGPARAGHERQGARGDDGRADGRRNDGGFARPARGDVPADARGREGRTVSNREGAHGARRVRRASRRRKRGLDRSRAVAGRGRRVRARRRLRTRRRGRRERRRGARSGSRRATGRASRKRRSRGRRLRPTARAGR
jgi:hypothetical protein